MRIWFHGTKAAQAAKISREGFAPKTHFAAHLEDALEYGGPFVFEVALSQEPARKDNWQMVVTTAVPTTAMVRLTQYTAAIREDHPERREAIFVNNGGSRG